MAQTLALTYRWGQADHSLWFVRQLVAVLALVAVALMASPPALACHPAGPTHREHCIETYIPTVADEGVAATIAIVGRNLGTDLHLRTAWTVRYGVARGKGTALGEIMDVLSWGPTAIEVQVPATLRPGTYWLALYNERGELQSNQLTGLTVPDQVVIRPVDPSLTVTLPRRIELRPTRLGTEWVFRERGPRGMSCPLSRRGRAHPLTNFLRDRMESHVGVGFSSSHGGGRRRCDITVRSSLVGRVLFDLPPLDGGRLLRAGLRFSEADLVADPGFEDCPTALSLLTAHRGPWPAGLQEVDAHAPTSVVPGAVRVGQVRRVQARHEWDVTGVIAAWVAGRLPNEGFALSGRPFPANRNSDCMAVFGGFRLVLDIGR